MIPCTTVDEGSRWLSVNIFIGLIQYDWDLNPVPWAAKSWEMAPNGLSYTFHLVENASWSDGVPFTSADVKFSYEEAVGKYHPRGKVTMSNVDHVDTPDNHTAVFIMKNLFPPFMAYMEASNGGIIPKHIYQGLNLLNDTKVFEPPVGMGPYLFEEWVRGDHITLVKNPNYFVTGKPYFDKIIAKVIPSEQGRIIALEAGEIDLLHGSLVPYSEVQRLEGLGFKSTTHGSEIPVLAEIFFNLHNMSSYNITNNIKVRQAIAYAINNTQLNEQVIYGTGIPAISQYPSLLGNWQNKNVPRYATNLTKANQLLDEAGYPRGSDNKRFKISLVTRAGLRSIDQYMQVIASMLDKVGIDLELRSLETQTAAEVAWTRWECDMHLEFCTSGPDPAVAIDRFFHGKYSNSKTAWQGGSGYNNTQVNALLDQGAQEVNGTIRKQLYDQVQIILMTELPTFPVVETTYVTMYSAKLNGRIPGGPYIEVGPLDEAWFEGESTGYVLPWQYIVAAVVVVIAVAASLIYIKFFRRKK
jgi:peptide/nickel transport system substrate-binding protein